MAACKIMNKYLDGVMMMSKSKGDTYDQDGLFFQYFEA